MSRFILTILEFIGYCLFGALAGLLILVIIASTCHAQLPTRIVPSYGGGYTIQHSNPTEFPTQVRPDGMGGFIANQLGHQPTYIHPDFNGGYTIYQPFHHQIMPPARLNDDDDEESR